MKDLELSHWVMLDDSKKTNNKTLPSFFYLAIVFACAYITTLLTSYIKY